MEKGEEWITTGMPDVTRFGERQVKFSNFNNKKKVKFFDWHGEGCSCNSFECLKKEDDDRLLILSEGRSSTPVYNMNEKKIMWKKAKQR